MVRRGLLFTAFFVALVAAVPLGCDTAGSTNRPFAKFAEITISRHAQSPAAANTTPDATDLPVLLYTVKGDPNQDVNLTQIDFTFSGSGAAGSVSTLKVYRDDGDAAFATPPDAQVGNGSFIGGVSSVAFTPAVVLPAGQSLSFFVTLDFAATPAPLGGSTYGVRIASNADVTAATSSGLAATVTGAPVDGSAYTMIGRLVIQAGPNMPANQSPNTPQSDVSVLQLQLDAPNEDVVVTSITFTGTAGPGLLSQLAGVKLYLDVNNDGQFTSGVDTQIGGTQTFGAGSTVTFGSLSQTVPRSSSPVYWMVLYDFGASHVSGDTFRCSLGSATNVTAMGAVSSSPAGVELVTTPIQGNNHVVVPRARLQIASGAQTPADGNAGAGVSNLLMLHLTVTETTSREAVTLTAVTIQVVGAGSPAGVPQTDVTQVKFFRDDGDASFEPGGGASDDPLLASTSLNSSDQALLTLTGEVIPSGGSRSYYVAIDLASTATNGSTFSVRLEDAWVSASGNTSLLAVTTSGGPVTGRTITVVPNGTLTITANSMNPGNLTQDRALTNIPMLSINLAMDAVEGAVMNSLTLSASGTGDDLNGITSVDLYYDADQTGTVTGVDVLLGSGSFGADDGTVTITLGTPRTINASSSEDWIAVVSSFVAANVWVGVNFRVGVAQGADASGTGTVTTQPVNVNGPPVWGGTQTIQGIWVPLFPGGTAPASRWGMLSVYDATNQQMVLYAGIGGTWSQAVNPYNDTWILSLTPGSETWAQLLTDAVGPTCASPIGTVNCRFWHDGVFDPVNNQLVIFGGRGGAGTVWFNDAWALPLTGSPTWTQLTPGGLTPPGRAQFQAAYDATNARMLLFGGLSYNGSTFTYYNDTQALTLGSSPAWSQLTTTSDPTGRCTHSVAYDPVSGRILVHAGDDGISTVFLDDSYSLDLGTNTWTQQAQGPALRAAHKACTDAAGKQMLIFGGGNSTTLFNDVISYNFVTDTWVSIPCSGTPPQTRYDHSVIWDSTNKQLIIAMGTQFYGDTTQNLPSINFNDVWACR